MGVGVTFAEAYRKAQLGASNAIPSSGTAFVSVRDQDKAAAVEVASELTKLGFDIVATRGTALVLEEAGVPVTAINKVREGRPHNVDMIKNGDIQLIINTTEGRQAIADSAEIRSSAESNGVYYTTTIAGGAAVVDALAHGQEDTVHRLQEMHEELYE